MQTGLRVAAYAFCSAQPAAQSRLSEVAALLSALRDAGVAYQGQVSGCSGCFWLGV